MRFVTGTSVNAAILAYTIAQLGKGYLVWDLVGADRHSNVKRKLLLAALYATFVGHPILLWLAWKTSGITFLVLALQVGLFLYLLLDLAVSVALLRVLRLPAGSPQAKEMLPKFKKPYMILTGYVAILLVVRTFTYVAAVLP